MVMVVVVGGQLGLDLEWANKVGIGDFLGEERHSTRSPTKFPSNVAKVNTQSNGNACQ